MNLQDQLNKCYTAQASHFHHTRSFHKRPELEHTTYYLDAQTKDTSSASPTLVDLWCGSWRVSERLGLNGYSHYKYIGVDPAQGMIEQAQTLYPSKSFVQQDMSSRLSQQSQQSLDVILCLASFHHLSTDSARLLALQNMYRALNYWWIAILINRSYSDRFVQKYKKHILQALWKYLITLWNRDRNDVLIPRKDKKYQENNHSYDRYYHMFTRAELKKLVQLSNFSLKEICYISQEWKKTSSRKGSRNSFLVLRK